MPVSSPVTCSPPGCRSKMTGQGFPYMRFLLRVLTLMSNRRDPGLRAPLIGLYGLLGLGNLAAWAWALLAFHDQPLLLGAALLAYGFGLRHAVDADHIAAIDNVTRKLMQEGKRPL